jgi:hypothetical protein
MFLFSYRTDLLEYFVGKKRKKNTWRFFLDRMIARVFFYEFSPYLGVPFWNSLKVLGVVYTSQGMIRG